MLLVLMLFLLSRSKGDNPLFKAKNCIITPHISWAAQASDRGLWILRLIISRLFWMVIRLTELTNRFFRCFDFLCMMCEERTAVSLFGVAVFSLCGGWNEPYTPGMWQRGWAGLRRRILLRLRKSAKNIGDRGQNSPLAQTAAPVSITPIPAALAVSHLLRSSPYRCHIPGWKFNRREQRIEANVHSA